MTETEVRSLFQKMISAPLSHIEAAHLRAEYDSMRANLANTRRAHGLALDRLADRRSQDLRIESTGLVTRVWVRGAEIEGIQRVTFQHALEGLPEMSLDLIPAGRKEPEP